MKTFNFIRAKFFSSPIDAFLTLSITYLIYLTIPPLVNWALIEATFTGDTKKDCVAGGACWVFVKMWFTRFYMDCTPMRKFGE